MERQAYVVGIQPNGSQLRFERWVFDNWLHNNLRDPFLVSLLYSCYRFY